MFATSTLFGCYTFPFSDITSVSYTHLGSSDFAMDYRPIMGGEERRQYIYDGLVAGQIKKGKSEADAMAYACLLYTSCIAISTLQ